MVSLGVRAQWPQWPLSGSVAQWPLRGELRRSDLGFLGFKDFRFLLDALALLLIWILAGSGFDLDLDSGFDFGLIWIWIWLAFGWILAGFGWIWLGFWSIKACIARTALPGRS